MRQQCYCTTVPPLKCKQ
uniref:Uncharacterized protein n=1 Tax=Anguilla anguilla TaxID=7936 RepID=A0A0E9UM41_ANGAN